VLWLWTILVCCGSLLAGGQNASKTHWTGSLLLAAGLTAFLLGAVPLLSLWLYGMIDSHKTAEKINSRR